MKRLVLFNSCFVSKRTDQLERTEPHVRLGIALIAAVLRERGHAVRILDPQAEPRTQEEIVRAVASFKPDIVAFAAYTQEISDAAEVAGRVKEACPEALTVIGGCHVSAIPSETLAEFPAFDLGIVGEGEEALALLAAGTPLTDIPGVVSRKGNDETRLKPGGCAATDLDALPFPAWDLYDLKRYRRSLPVELVRGCPFSCVFCFRVTGSGARFKSPERAVQEIAFLKERYGYRDFFLGSGGTFPLSREHAVGVCQGILDARLKISWSTSTRVNLLDEKLLRLMKQSGCSFISLGIESGDAGVLAHADKGITPEAAERAVRLCHEAGVQTELDFVLGLPEETRESLGRTREMVERLRDVSTLANFAILTPFPGTEVYRMAQKGEGGFSFRTRDWRQFSKQGGSVLARAQFREGELEAFQAELYRRYYFGSWRKVLQMFTSGRAWELFSWARLMALVQRLAKPHGSVN